jgi:hypothetical protein
MARREQSRFTPQGDFQLEIKQISPFFIAIAKSPPLVKFNHG